MGRNSEDHKSFSKAFFLSDSKCLTPLAIAELKSGDQLKPRDPNILLSTNSVTIKNCDTEDKNFEDPVMIKFDTSLMPKVDNPGKIRPFCSYYGMCGSFCSSYRGPTLFRSVRFFRFEALT